ncbi:Hint domain-containing protein [Bordetella sp. 02P26C-1]|uniref:Hint domain-containing protein n=1 Tax=Bordetella sp. 02P26C-1 TaxID=2683195 RepID=UPI0013549E19|nr:Hint domain-containing protein [Bordetella sp. 02P26C-1]MVW80216.1 hypothetical protein [Bordetella sp. 02P26C-1]
MATYETSFASALMRMENGSFTVLATSAAQSTAIESVGDGVFEQGELVTIDTTINDSQIQTTIEGLFEDGYVIYADGGYVLFTNTQYEEGTTFTLESGEEGGTPGLPVCFTAGTLIDTPQGPVAIEELKVGDVVLGASGLRTVKWVGWRHYQLRSPRLTEADRQDIMPVRIKVHALADQVPARDIVLSPWHHVFIDNVLVKANQLINGHSIVQETQLSRVTYFHLELDQFDVVRAHNLYSESWADGGNRDFFENVDVATLRPEDQMRRRAVRPGFTVLSGNDARLAAIQARIAARVADVAGASRMEKAA